MALVEFFADAVKIGEDAVSLYGIDWTPGGCRQKEAGANRPALVIVPQAA